MFNFYFLYSIYNYFSVFGDCIIFVYFSITICFVTSFLLSFFLSFFLPYFTSVSPLRLSFLSAIYTIFSISNFSFFVNFFFISFFCNTFYISYFWKFSASFAIISTNYSKFYILRNLFLNSAFSVILCISSFSNFIISLFFFLYCCISSYGTFSWIFSIYQNYYIFLFTSLSCLLICFFASFNNSIY